MRSETSRIAPLRLNVLVDVFGRVGGAWGQSPWDGDAMVKPIRLRARTPFASADSARAREKALPLHRNFKDYFLEYERDSRPAAGCGEQQELPARIVNGKQSSPYSDALSPQKSWVSGAHGRIAREQ